MPPGGGGMPPGGGGMPPGGGGIPPILGGGGIFEAPPDMRGGGGIMLGGGGMLGEDLLRTEVASLNKIKFPTL